MKKSEWKRRAKQLEIELRVAEMDVLDGARRAQSELRDRDGLIGILRCDVENMQQRSPVSHNHQTIRDVGTHFIVSTSAS